MNALVKQQRIRHLLERTGFGVTPAELAGATRRSLRSVVRQRLTDSAGWEPLHVVESAEFVPKNVLKDSLRAGQMNRVMLRERIRENADMVRDLNLHWLDKMAAGPGALREKMALFWHGHFACRAMGKNPLFMQQYVNTLRQHALGRFGDLLTAVSKEPAMLQFLNNQQNRKNAPNENFAREVMELFTLGRSALGTHQRNYTEHDVKEAARAFTGWQFSPDGRFVFRENVHDDGDKTIFGKTGPFRGDDVLAMLLENRQTARYVTAKLYRYFVNETEDPGRIDQLANQFYASGYDIAGLLEAIFTADWFYDPRNVGVHVKSPVELLTGMRHTLGVRFDQPQPQIFVQRTLGQLLFYPPNVAGWPGGKNWIDSSSLLFRMQLPAYVLKAAEVNVVPKADGDVTVQSLAQKGGAQFHTTVDWPSFEAAFAQTPAEQLPDALADVLLPFPLRPDQRTLVLNQTKPDQPPTERIRSLTAALMSLPEYQLS